MASTHGRLERGIYGGCKQVGRSSYSITVAWMDKQSGREGVSIMGLLEGDFSLSAPLTKECL